MTDESTQSPYVVDDDPRRAPDELTPEQGVQIEAAYAAEAAEDRQAVEEAAEEEKLKLAELVIRIVEARADLFHDPREAPYAIVRLPDGPRRVLPLRSRAMRSWIARTVRTELGHCVGANAIDEALVALEGIARYDRPRRDVHLRVAEHEGALYVDLGDETGACIAVTRDGWRVLDAAPVLFRRPDAMRALPRPERDGKLDDLRAHVNLADDDGLYLLAAWLVAAYRPGRPVPVLAFYGEQGTAKSTASRVARGLVDPNAAPVRSAPRVEDDLAVAAQHSHVVAFDNLSGVQPWLSDALCRVVTGGGLSKRTLYTDDEETVLDAMRPIVVNGIDDLANRPDLAERCLVLTLRPIPRARRRAERAFWRAYAAAAPRILGVLLDGVASALRGVDTVRIAELPRMADFALWVAAAEPGLGLAPGTLLAAYERNRARVVDAALDASPVATAVRRLLDQPRHGGRWAGEPAQLLAELSALTAEETRRTPGWPKTPRALSSALRRAATFLRSIGVTLDLDGTEGHDKRRVYRLSADPPRGREVPATPSAPSASSAAAENGCETADANADGRGTQTVRTSSAGADADANGDGPSRDRPHDRPHANPEKTALADDADDAGGPAVPPDLSGDEIPIAYADLSPFQRDLYDLYGRVHGYRVTKEIQP